MRIPDYHQMRIMLAESEAENIDGNDLVELLLDGCCGYMKESNEDIMEDFIGRYEAHRMPWIKMEVDKQQCTTCGKLVCTCKD